ncbi:hypothetical protein E1301_Tti011945 [Triplophysa tibetana]|uniref:EGF-like domain-containing protein n=1 Tax=Triplophysa tibetana TaxID=1572043 RepID=A0A5A9PKB3_9TELE|nr:hypothetical protein E1301_Tti011945 [Triplophysa tibetana]
MSVDVSECTSHCDDEKPGRDAPGISSSVRNALLNIIECAGKVNVCRDKSGSIRYPSHPDPSVFKQRWNTSDTSHDPALIPYTHSDANPVSPSPSGSNGVTYTPDIPQRTHIPKTNTPREMTPAGSSTPEGDTKPLPDERDCRNLTCTPYVPSSVQQNEGRLRKEESTTPLSIPSSGFVSPRMNPNVTSDLTVEDITTKPLQSNVDFSVMTHTNSPTLRSLTTNFKTTHGNDVHTGSIENTKGITTPTAASKQSPSSVDNKSTQTSALSTPVSITTSSAVYPPELTTKQSKMILQAASTESPSVQIHSHFPVTQPSTIIPPKHTTKSVHVTRTDEHAISIHAVTQTSLIQSTPSNSDRKWMHGRHYFILEDQPAIIKGLQTDVCDWLFECPSGFQCVFSKINASCTSVCHFDYCKHQGICVHRPDHQPLCQCPVGEDYWFMGQRCDLRMTRPRLAGVCFGVLIAVAAVMALLSYLAVRRFKSMLMQAKVEQTRSSYRRFNHFDELSARFWGRSWPGSDDSLDNPAFTRSDEILHLRALDRTCCYHDDTLSVVSTYHGSGTHLNTIYPHSSQYGWDLSNCSLADGVVDSGKASDLSVCSWPIEPIQWTPFPLLQQLNRNTTPGKVSRPRSYCEGMELVDLEKSWTS